MKLNKEEVYVEVTTQEEADKAKEMLLKYGEKIWEDTSAFKVIKSADYKYLLFLESGWFVGSKYEHRNQVTLEQLEEILSRKTKSQRITALEAEVKELKERVEKLESSPRITGVKIHSNGGAIQSETISDSFSGGKTEEQPRPQFEVGMFGAFWDDDFDKWKRGKLGLIETNEIYKFKCEEGFYWKNFRPIKEIIWE